MNAADATRELIKSNAVADKDWHGEKLEMKTQEQRAEEAWAESELEQGANGQQTDAAENGRFEIEMEDSSSKRLSSLNNTDANVFDTLQRQRSAPKAAV